MPSPLPLNQYDVDIARLKAKTLRQRELVSLAKAISLFLFLLAALYMILQGLRPVIDREASTIQALATLVKAMHADAIVMTVVSGVLGTAYGLERRGKKRALAQKAELQRRLEAGDPYRSSSENPL